MAESTRIVFMGTPDFAVPSLRALIEAGEDVIAVVTQPDKPRGRKREPQPPPVKVVAREHGIDVRQPKGIRRGPFPERLKELAPDLVVVVAYGKIIPEDMLAVPRLGFINVHASLLPAYRGAAPIHHAIINGETRTGITIMQLDPGMDTGDMIHKVECPIDPGMTAGELHDRLAPLGARALMEALPSIKARTATRTPQDDARATMAPLLKKEDGQIDWTHPAGELERRVRGLHPWPGTHTTLRGHLLKVFPPVEVRPPAPEAAPGMVLAATEHGIDIACGEGALRLTELQIEGKRRMIAGPFLRGVRLAEGERLGNPEPADTKERTE